MMLSNQKPFGLIILLQGSGGGKNLAATQRQRTQGTVSLLRLLKTNLHSLV